MLFRPFRFPRRTTTVFCSAATFLLLLFGKRRSLPRFLNCSKLQAEVVPDPSSWSSEEPLSVYESAGPVRTADATVYVVTHTYLQATQAPDLMRLSQALMLAQANIFWVVVEAADQPSQTVRHIVRRSGLAAVHLAKRPSSTMNAALAWLRANATLPGVVYFANEHHTYDRRIFAQVLVWHAKTESGEFPPKKILSNRKLVDTNIPILYKNVVDI
ncbi:galactosylgalactosylxylosylprotein 3-beta-glucuronosyltransferase 2-like isoform X3 [Amblyomma americanum]